MPSYGNMDTMPRSASAPHLRVVDGPDATGDESAAWVEAAREGNTRAWAKLYRHHFGDLMRHTAYLTGDVGLAEDIVQEAFAIALVNLHKYDARAPFLAWLRGVATNLVRKHWRKQQRRGRAYGRLEELAEQLRAGGRNDLESELTRDRRADALTEALATLPENLREAFVLSDVQGLSATEGAAQLDISAGNFRVRASRARARLRSEFERLGLIDTPEGGSSS
jgi:RNA polymerase sigma-70 factor (ECF subfamily)